MMYSQKEKVDQLYKEFKTFNPFEIAEHLEIDIDYVEFLEKPLGRIANFFGNPTILLSNSIKEMPSSFFICAHELYHAIEHKGFVNYYMSNIVARSKMEVEANVFATSLVLEDYIETYAEKPKTFSDIQNKYGVPSSLMEYFF